MTELEIGTLNSYAEIIEEKVMGDLEAMEKELFDKIKK